MTHLPGFLDLPKRPPKPRDQGITHVLDNGSTRDQLAAVLAHAGEYIDIVKMGWGTAYIDHDLAAKAALVSEYGATLCLGGTLFEICAIQNRLDSMIFWAQDAGIPAIEVSNGLGALTIAEKQQWISALSKEFVVLSETGRKNSPAPANSSEWISEMEGDLAAGARFVIAEGRESGTVGLYNPDGSLRGDLACALATHIGVDRVVFEAPRKSQQQWFVQHLGANVNLGNIATGDVSSVETLRLGLRADTVALTAQRSSMSS